MVLKIFNPFDQDDDGDIRNGTAERAWFACRPSEAKDKLIDSLPSREEQDGGKQRTPFVQGIPIVGEVD